MADRVGAGLRHGCGRLRHDQRYVIVHAGTAEPVVAAEFQRQPRLAGWLAEHLAVAPANAVPRRLAIAGWFTVAGFRVAFGRRERFGRPTLATELAAAGTVHPVGSGLTARFRRSPGWRRREWQRRQRSGRLGAVDSIGQPGRFARIRGIARLCRFARVAGVDPRFAGREPRRRIDVRFGRAAGRQRWEYRRGRHDG